MSLPDKDKMVLTTPLGFALKILQMPLYPWQAAAIVPLADSVGPKGKVTQIAVRSPNEGGRSSRVIVAASLWWVSVHEKGKVAITTADAKQLNEQVIPSMESYAKRLEGYEHVRSPYFRLDTPSGGRIIGFTTDDPGRAEGLHSGDSIEAPLLWIVDEAKSVGRTYL